VGNGHFLSPKNDKGEGLSPDSFKQKYSGKPRQTDNLRQVRNPIKTRYYRLWLAGQTNRAYLWLSLGHP
jgi:hypothetical protein